MTDDLDRAERAFRSALAERVSAYEPVAMVAPGPARRRRWPALLAVAALVVVVVGAGLAVRATRHDHAAPTDLPAGWRWESHRDVMVAVPGTWGYAAAPDDQWCVGGARHAPAQGYVDTSRPTDGSTDVKCTSDIPPASAFAVHLSFLDRTRPAPVPAGWQNLSRIVAGQRLTVVTDPAHVALARRILATVRVVDTDQNGCDTTSRIQQQGRVRPPAFDITRLDGVETIAVCQYDLEVTDQPGLNASRMLTGRDARDELAALQAAPLGGGPDRPNSCLHSMWDDAGLVLRFTSTDGTTHDMYAYYDGCFANGIDDGTHVRELTTDDCRPLWSDRVRDLGGIPAAFTRCVAPRR